MPCQYRGVRMNQTNYIQEYLKQGFSLIPIKANTKEPLLFKWKPHQTTRATFEDVLEWHTNYGSPNIAIVTGEISNLVVIDLDDPSKLEKLKSIIPEIDKTTRVYTPNRGAHHYYFLLDTVIPKSTNNLFNLGIELRANGRYVLAPPSQINGNEYIFQVPLTQIKPYPLQAIELQKQLELEQNKPPEQEQLTRDDIIKLPAKLPRYRGKNVSCISQIYQRKLQVGVRDTNLFILYNLLVQNGNKKEYARQLVVKKNNSLKEPLTDRELKKIFRREYSYTCSKIRQELTYLNCSNCEHKFKGGKFNKMRNILIKNINKLPELTNAEAKIALILGTYFDGETPSNYELAKVSGMDKRTLNKAIEGLKKKGIKNIK